MRARKGTGKQKTQPGAAATTHYRFRISWVLLILLLLLALVAIALPGHARVTGRTLNAVARHEIRFQSTDDSGQSSSVAAAPSCSQLVAGATASPVCFCHVGLVQRTKSENIGDFYEIRNRQSLDRYSVPYYRNSCSACLLSDNELVASSESHSIEKFDSSGNWIRTFASTGPWISLGILSRPVTGDVFVATGNVTTDAQGQATVQLPEWFEVLNTDFRYQLTVIGQFAQAIVADEIRDHQFSIRTNAPNVKVSWQVTGVRQDAFAKAHPLVVEEKKDARLHGFYIHPELYGATEEKQIEWARHPEMMKRMKEQRVPAHPAIKTVVRAQIR